MRHLPTLLGVLLVVILGASLLAQEADEATTSEEEAVPEDLVKLTIPGKPHELLEGTVGEWVLTIRIWRSLDTEPLETMGTATGAWILGDRFVETRYQGEVMERPFEGLKIEGYDKAAGHYVSTWRDNMNTQTLVFQGQCGDDGTTREMTANFLDPVSKTLLIVKGVTTLTSDDSYLYESFVVTPDGSEFKNMELEATRR